MQKGLFLSIIFLFTQNAYSAWLSYEEVMETSMPGFKFQMPEGQEMPPGFEKMMEKQMREQSKPTVAKVYLGNGKMARVSDGVTVINDFGSYSSIIVNHRDKTWSKQTMDPDKIGFNLDMVYKGTGRYRKVNGFKCEIVKTTMLMKGGSNKKNDVQMKMGSKGEQCIALKPPKAWQDYMNRSFKTWSKTGKKIKLHGKRKYYGGFAILSESMNKADFAGKEAKKMKENPFMQASQGMKMKTTLRKVSTKAFNPSVFSVPKGYKLQKREISSNEGV